MLTKHGKFYARWTGPDGKRHTKAFRKKAAALTYQRKMHNQAAGKKGRTPATSARSRRRGRALATAPMHASPSPKTSAPPSATSDPTK